MLKETLDFGLWFPRTNDFNLIGYTDADFEGCQEERIDYDETFTPVARLESIRMLLGFLCFKSFKLFQMNVKSAFLNGYLEEEVYVEQPPGFENEKFPNHVYRLIKVWYGLKQAPRAWYERLISHLRK